MKALCAVLLLGLAGCGGFREVADAAGSDGAADGTLADGPTTDGKPALDSSANLDGKPPADGAADLGGKLPAGSCCAKPGDCVSDICSQQGGGPAYCNKVCSTSPDDCPVGFRCEAASKRCVPPPLGGYQCGAHVVAAGQQPLGGCCGKADDCVSGECVNVADGEYFCTVACTRSPDDCPVGYSCSTAQLCATPTASTCSYK